MAKRLRGRILPWVSIPPAGIRRLRVCEMSETVTYRVPGMSCEHCKTVVSEELSAVEGVESVDVDLQTKLVRVAGAALDDSALRAAIDDAGYEVA